ncbi:MAG: long-chain fatty acid--CoA ligase [Gemmatimonadales bacterium]
MLPGLTMDFQLTLDAIRHRAETLWPRRSVVSRNADDTLHRTTLGESLHRAGRLASALRRLGIRPGDRVATLCWNHHRHFEAYFGVPMPGAVLHTLNLRLHPDELGYIASHADDRAVIVDRSLLPLLESFRSRTAIDHVIVISDDGATPEGTHDYESLLAAEADTSTDFTEPNERDAASMCYTSGTTGRAKAVVYSHRALVLHSMATALPGSLALGEDDVVLAAVPMFHANAWGLPYTAALTGAALVFPGEHPDARALLDLCHSEGVTCSAGVPTLWLGVLAALDAAPATWDLTRLRTLVIGGAAAPEALVRGLEERHGLRPITSWGMTEIAPVGTTGRLTTEAMALPPEERHSLRMKAGLPGALLELRVRTESGLVPWDGATMGELEVRGAYVSSAYYRPDDGDRCFTDDGWFRTGDIASIDAMGYLDIRDRGKDLIKSGGEWISSVALEGALMSHPAVAEAAVVAVPHPKWLERPAAAVVLREGHVTTPAELREYLAVRFPRWWLPDDVVFVRAIPRTSTGKFLKSALRDALRDRLSGA